MYYYHKCHQRMQDYVFSFLLMDSVNILWLNFVQICNFCILFVIYGSCACLVGHPVFSGVQADVYSVSIQTLSLYYETLLHFI